MDQRTRKLLTLNEALRSSDGINIYYVYGKDGRGFTNIEDAVDASIQGLENCITKSKKKRLISTAINTIGNISTSKEITKTSKPTWEQK